MKAVKQVRDLLKPPQWASWQTLISLAAFSAIVASFTTSDGYQIAQRIISSFGWVFLILGVWWLIYEPEVKKKLTFYTLFLGPWLVGVLICVYLFGTWQGKPIPAPAALVSWPALSTIVWASPKFVKSDPKTKSPVYTNPSKEKRQDIVLVLLVNLLISCWLQFHFTVQNWFELYPSLKAEDFRRSEFVNAFTDPKQRQELSRGVDLLKAAENGVKEQLEGKDWSVVERWLEQLQDVQLSPLRSTVQSRLPDIPESRLWTLNASTLPANRPDAYDLRLEAAWGGPSSRRTGTKLSKTCAIRQTRKLGPPAQFNFDSPAPPAQSKPRPRIIATVQCRSDELKGQ
jgi:hypothetical protein